jgi:hypothetical protein
VVSVTREIHVVDPHLGRLLNADSVACGEKNLRNFDITNDDIRLPQNTEPNADKSYKESGG